MTIVTLADAPVRKEIEDKGIPPGVEWVWVDSPGEMERHPGADLYFDLEFRMDQTRIGQLARLSGPVVVNAVPYTLQEIGRPFIRINGWPGFLERKYCELAAVHRQDEEKIGVLFERLGWQYRFVADIPGLISPRILAMIINEAFYTLQDKVSTREEIDTAMKLGTNYPFGPFEWASKIGLAAIDELLAVLSLADSRYAPSPMLKQAATGLKFD